MYSGTLAKTVTIFISIAIETLSLRCNLNTVMFNHAIQSIIKYDVFLARNHF